MKTKSQITVASVLLAGVMITGCQQQESLGGQQVTTPAPAPAPAPVVKPAPAPVVRPAPMPAPQPLIPQVKAKGHYKGPVYMDRSSQNVLQNYR